MAPPHSAVAESAQADGAVEGPGGVGRAAQGQQRVAQALPGQGVGWKYLRCSLEPLRRGREVALLEQQVAFVREGVGGGERHAAVASTRQIVASVIARRSSLARARAAGLLCAR